MDVSSPDNQLSWLEAVGLTVDEFLLTRPLTYLKQIKYGKVSANNRTKYDASISSGLAIMANRRHKYSQEVKKSKINVNFARYNNNGGQSQINKYG